MKKINIVKENRVFNDIIRTGKQIKNRHYVLYYKVNTNNKYYRFGISVGKKIGNAVTRNCFKRKLRSIIDNNKNYYEFNKDYIIIVRKSCLDCSFEQLNNSFKDLFIKYERGKNEKEK